MSYYGKTVNHTICISNINWNLTPKCDELSILTTNCHSTLKSPIYHVIAHKLIGSKKLDSTITWYNILDIVELRHPTLESFDQCIKALKYLIGHTSFESTCNRQGWVIQSNHKQSNQTTHSISINPRHWSLASTHSIIGMVQKSWLTWFSLLTET